MADSRERVRTLAFVRLLGHLLSDGSISVFGQGRMNVGQALDRDAVLDDIELVTGKRPAGSRYDERKWSIVLPMELTASIMTLPGVRVGKRIEQASTLPAFLLDDALPRRPGAGVPRRMCSAPTATAQPCASAAPRSTKRRSSCPAYSQSALPQHVEAAEANDE